MNPFVQDVDFLFIYEVRNREIDSICLLWAYLESKGYKLGLINTWDSTYNFHPEYRAKVAVLSACYTDEAYAYFTGQALAFDKVVNMQWEQVLMNGATHGSGQTDWDFSGEIPARTRHVCWGEDNRDYLMKRYGFPAENLRVCGYLPLDFYREEFRETTEKREPLFTRFGLDPAKKTVLFISSFADLGKPVSDMAILQNEGQDEWENIRVQEKSQKAILDWFRRLGKENPELQIVYRPHPAEANNPELNACEAEVPGFHVINKESIRNWILNCDILCNWKSTSMIETYVSGKQTLILHPEEIPFNFSMPFFEKGHYRAVTTYEELAAGIRAENAEYPIEKDKLLRFYSVTDQPAYERTGQFLIDTLEDPDYHSPDIGGHASAKGRILIHRPQARLAAGKAKLCYRLRQMRGGEIPENVQEDYRHHTYYEQKMRQNRISGRELREKVDAYKRMMGDTGTK